MNEQIRKKLFEAADKKYGEFSSSLIPGCDNLIGVRLPYLRKMAQETVKEQDNWRECMSGEDIYFEEKMLRGMIIGYGCFKDKDTDAAAYMLEGFVPLIDNWSVCDSFCLSFKSCELDREKFLDIIEKYTASEKEFEARTGLILLLSHYLRVDENGGKIARKRVIEPDDLEGEKLLGMYTEKIFELLSKEYSQGYYASMAAAWLMAESFAVYPAASWSFLNGGFVKTDAGTYNRALRKICESKNPSPEVKQRVKLLKRRQDVRQSEASGAR